MSQSSVLPMIVVHFDAGASRVDASSVAGSFGSWSFVVGIVLVPQTQSGTLLPIPVVGLVVVPLGSCPVVLVVQSTCCPSLTTGS